MQQVPYPYGNETRHTLIPSWWVDTPAKTFQQAIRRERFFRDRDRFFKTVTYQALQRAAVNSLNRLADIEKQIGAKFDD